MKKILLSILFLFLCLAVSANAANWFAGSGDTDFNAVSGTTISSVWNSNADGTSGTYLDWATQPANGDVFIANGATVAIDANIGSDTVTVTLTTEGSDYGGTDGGGFTVSTTSTLVLYTNIIAGTSNGLTISGSTGSLTINGNITGSVPNGGIGVNDGHSGAGVTVTVNGNVTAGVGINAYGYQQYQSTGTVTVNGTCTGAGGTGFYSTSNGTTNILNCAAGTASWASYGCKADSASAGITVTGNLLYSDKAGPTVGRILYQPASDTNYIKYFNTGSTYKFIGNPSANDKVLASGTTMDITDGSRDAGTAAAGGGAWGF